MQELGVVSETSTQIIAWLPARPFLHQTFVATRLGVGHHLHLAHAQFMGRPLARDVGTMAWLYEQRQNAETLLHCF